MKHYIQNYTTKTHKEGAYEEMQLLQISHRKFAKKQRGNKLTQNTLKRIKERKITGKDAVCGRVKIPRDNKLRADTLKIIKEKRTEEEIITVAFNIKNKLLFAKTNCSKEFPFF